MPDRNTRTPQNVAGAWYVDNTCIDCDVCRDIAEDNFTRHDAGSYSYVYRQPRNDHETALCQEALECCPVEAIGNNG